MCTGTFNQTFYVTGGEQIGEVIDLAHKIDNAFLAKLALYARQHALMKDTPVVLLAILCVKADGQPFAKAIFKDIVNNGKQLRNFVQVMRGGAVGRKSLGNFAKNLVNEWLLTASDRQFINANIGNKPTLRDVIRLSHPKPFDDKSEALIKWALQKDFNYNHLPPLARSLLDFQKDNQQPLPDLPIEWLMSLDLTTEHWAGLAKQGSWQMVRMNLNTFVRHGVFGVDGMAQMLADKLADEQAVKHARAFPYQLYATWQALGDDVPAVIKNALKTAMSHALANVPRLDGQIAIGVDVSGSMHSPVMGYRRGATSQVRCIDVASLFASAMKVANPTAMIMPFDTRLHQVIDFNDNISQITGKKPFSVRLKSAFGKADTAQTPPAVDVLALAERLAKFGGGGTHTALPLAELNRQKAKIDVMIYFSDNESWADEQSGRGTQMMKEWRILKKRCPNAKLICVDLQPYTSSQAKNGNDVLNVGGFGDNVFKVIEAFCCYATR
ncbi:RNA-binding protein [Moraxella bovis]|uniref:vWA domain-containing protein n=1 Tax=Moraxella bovis TaxID=476 RepID=UPI0022266E0E|nr:RNA-binding protein [Moraxella bovis]UZA29744.1 RNA-binding protein [Moraxella bovis]